MANEAKQIVARKSVQKFEMPDGSVKEIEVTHTRRKADDDRMQRRLKHKGVPAGMSDTIPNVVRPVKAKSESND